MIRSQLTTVNDHVLLGQMAGPQEPEEKVRSGDRIKTVERHGEIPTVGVGYRKPYMTLTACSSFFISNELSMLFQAILSLSPFVHYMIPLREILGTPVVSD